jgi:hypothetical protein
VKFPTRICNNSGTTIDNIFLDYDRFKKFEVKPIINGISDHDAQLVQIYNIDTNTISYNKKVQYRRKINHNSLTSFAQELSFETWEEIFDGKEVNRIFNTLVNIILRIFYSNFPVTEVNINNKDTGWLTPSIKALTRVKQDYYLLSRRFDDQKLKKQYKYICKTLTITIKEAKRLY